MRKFNASKVNQKIITDKRLIIRYLLIGGLSYLVEMASLVVLKHAKLSDVGAVAISFWIGLISAFILQKFIAFKDTRKEHRVILFQIITYLILVGFNYAFTLIWVHLLQNVADVYILRTLAIIITTVWNFFFYKSLIFKSHEDTS